MKWTPKCAAAIEEHFAAGGKSIINKGLANQRELSIDILMKRFQQFFEESERLVKQVHTAVISSTAAGSRGCVESCIHCNCVESSCPRLRQHSRHHHRAIGM